jgi:hypothetical protein
VTALLPVLGDIAAVAGWLIATRLLFLRWRPSRVPLCGRNKHDHAKYCYRRRKPDLTTTEIDSDAEAMFNAAFVGLFWPVVLLFLAMTARIPELPQERERRLEKEKADRDKHIAELEAANEKLRQAGS